MNIVPYSVFRQPRNTFPFSKGINDEYASEKFEKALIKISECALFRTSLSIRTSDAMSSSLCEKKDKPKSSIASQDNFRGRLSRIKLEVKLHSMDYVL